MFVIRGKHSGQPARQRTATFTGTVWGDALHATPEGIGMSTVYFTPGARTHWHRHEGGQVLTVVSGQGIVATRDGEAVVLRSGDIVWTEPGVEHWHGSCDDSMFVHTSTSIGDTDWYEPVEDRDYQAAHTARDAPRAL